MTLRTPWRIVTGVALAMIVGVCCLQGRLNSKPTAVSRSSPEPTGGVNEPSGAHEAATPLPPLESPIHLRDVSALSGIDFRHSSAMSAERYPPEAMGSGVAMFDFDCDGRMDLHFLTETSLPVEASRLRPRNMLYRSTGRGTFEDVTDPSGLGHNGFSHGVAVGDIDNDGFADLYLGCYGVNVLYKNQGDGTFANVAEPAGVADSGWGTSSAFFDFDQDGDLDLYHCRYAYWSIQTHIYCGGPERSARTYCHPSMMPPQHHILYSNNGDGIFADVSVQAGVYREDGRGLGVVAADLNGDGHVDLYIANDTTANFLFWNRGNGTFQDASEESGAAYNLDGVAEASMGVDAEDVNGDGWPELFVTNFWMEHNTLYRNQQGRYFLDIADPSGLGGPSRAAMGWGTKLIDLDMDGWPDCFVVNGHLDNNLKDVGVHTPYRQQAQLWRNRGHGKFQYLPTRGGAYFSTVHVGRGVAFGDLNNDGYPDIVVNHLDEGPGILMNDSPLRPEGPPNHWIRLGLLGTASNRDAVGSKIDLRAGDLRIRTQMKGGTSYLSAHDPRLLVGLGLHRTVDELVISWPSGGETRVLDLDADCSYLLVENLLAHVTAPVPVPVPSASD